MYFDESLFLILMSFIEDCILYVKGMWYFFVYDDGWIAFLFFSAVYAATQLTNLKEDKKEVSISAISESLLFGFLITLLFGLMITFLFAVASILLNFPSSRYGGLVALVVITVVAIFLIGIVQSIKMIREYFKR